jgi:hypothetical protein
MRIAEGEEMKRLLFVIAIIFMMVEHAYAGGCTVVDFTAYSKVVGVGNYGDLWIGTMYCAAYTIQNDDAGSRFDIKFKAQFVDGKSMEEIVNTSRINIYEKHSGTVCFYSGAPIRSLSCSW